MSTTRLPGQHHIDEISRRLWSGREIGKAAVMIGAGFSRNANPLNPAAPPPPLLENIAQEIFETLYPSNSMPESERLRLKARMTSGTAIMNLASEFEIVFGRQSLDDLLNQSVADDQHMPSEVHELLLALPWSDVFTTNYDTLIERTRPRIYNRRYDLIHNAADIPGSMKPRIVKLHGTFPSHRPFIITDEDYRTFPRLFPPFVNIVQESIMENAFCLLGFSGNDPNFIYWSGWVRDHLGSSAPPIYLCGLLQLTDPQMRLLESRGVIPIDLSPIVRNVDTHDSQLKHRLAVEWFLRYLKANEPVSRNSWPQTVKREPWNSGYDLPTFGSTGPEDVPEPIASALSPLDAATAEQLQIRWAKERANYPGWVITPYHKRIALSHDTETFSPRIVKALSNLPCPTNLFLAYELNWREERCLRPIRDNWSCAYESVITSLNPFPRSLPSLTCSINRDAAEHSSLPWPQISDCWVELVFALARSARENENEVSFKRWIELLRPIAGLKPDWRSRWFHEQASFEFFRFNQAAALILLKDWPRQPSSFWEAKRAALLGELGNIEEAVAIAEQLLADVRAAIQPYVTDYALLSQESWLMLLLFTLDRLKQSGSSQRLQQRWDELKAYEMDPWFERNNLQSQIQTIANESRSRLQHTTNFDPMSHTTHFWSGPSLFSRVSDAFSYLRLFEDAALPMRVGSLHMSSEPGAISAALIYPFFPSWALSAMIRSDKDELRDTWFDRVRVATLTQDQVTKFATLLTKALREAVNAVAAEPRQALMGKTFLTQNLETFSDIVSRLCFRLSSEELESLFNFAIEMYNSSAFRQYSSVYRKTADLLLQRVIFAFPRGKLLEKLGVLLALPIAGEPGYESANPDLVHEPFHKLEWPKSRASNDQFDRSSWAAPISHLIDLVKHGTPVTRERAIHRLLFVDEIRALSPDEINLLREALWSRLDESGLPANRNMYLWVLLRFAPPGRDDDFKSEIAERLVSLSFSDSYYFEEVIGATAPARLRSESSTTKFTWSEAQAERLFVNAREWWERERALIEAEQQKGIIDLKDRHADSIHQLLTMLGKAILPNLTPASASAAELLTVVQEIEALDYSTLVAQPLTLFVDATRLPDTVTRLRTALSSSNEDESRQAIFALYWWLLHSSHSTLPKPPIDLIVELGNKIAHRREPALLSAILQTSLIIDEMPNSLPDSFIELLARGLDYLLTDTELPTEKERAELNQREVIIRVEDRPNYRAAATLLAASLHRAFENKSKPYLNVLAKWKETAAKDVLPEVRVAWQESATSSSAP